MYTILCKLKATRPQSDDCCLDETSIGNTGAPLTDLMQVVYVYGTRAKMSPYLLANIPLVFDRVDSDRCQVPDGQN